MGDVCDARWSQAWPVLKRAPPIYKPCDCPFRRSWHKNYFLLRTLDAQKKTLDDTVIAYQKALELTQNRYAAGVAAKADVVLAQTQLKSPRHRQLTSGSCVRNLNTPSHC